MGPTLVQLMHRKRGTVEGISFNLSGYQDEDGSINMTLEANDTIKIDIRYSDPMLAQAVISNLPHILEDMLDEAFEESFNYNIDEELKRILEEGK